MTMSRWLAAAVHYDASDYTAENVFSEIQQQVLSIVSRTSAGICLVSGICMALMAFRHGGGRHSSNRVYHRIHLGMAFHIISYGGWKLYGTAAVPVGTPNAWNARGTTETCSAQGFFLQLAFCISFYYVFLSLYSYQAVSHNFDKTKYKWIERWWTHVLVHLFPVASASYMLSIQSFNFSGGVGCYIASVPFGCGDESGVPCQRGPQNPGRTTWFWAGIPMFFVLITPTVVMIALYRFVRRKQDAVCIQANKVAKQASLYLFALYWSYVFSAINTGFKVFRDENVFVLDILSTIMLHLQGLWILLIYRHFTVPRPRTISNGGSGSSSDESPSAPSSRRESIQSKNSQRRITGSTELHVSARFARDSTMEELTEEPLSTVRFSVPATNDNDNNSYRTDPTIIRPVSRETATSSAENANQTPGRKRQRWWWGFFVRPWGSGTTTTTPPPTNTKKLDAAATASSAIAGDHTVTSSPPQSPSMATTLPMDRSSSLILAAAVAAGATTATATAASFNIFDGSNASGAFAQFVYDCDSDDIVDGNDDDKNNATNEDAEESEYWSTIQDHV